MCRSIVIICKTEWILHCWGFKRVRTCQASITKGEVWSPWWKCLSQQLWNLECCHLLYSTYVACAAKQALAFRGTHQRFTIRLHYMTLNKTAVNSGILFIRYLALGRDPPQWNAAAFGASFIPFSDWIYIFKFKRMEFLSLVRKLKKSS